MSRLARNHSRFIALSLATALYASLLVGEKLEPVDSAIEPAELPPSVSSVQAIPLDDLDGLLDHSLSSTEGGLASTTGVESTLSPIEASLVEVSWRSTPFVAVRYEGGASTVMSPGASVQLGEVALVDAESGMYEWEDSVTAPSELALEKQRSGREDDVLVDPTRVDQLLLEVQVAAGHLSPSIASQLRMERAEAVIAFDGVEVPISLAQQGDPYIVGAEHFDSGCQTRDVSQFFQRACFQRYRGGTGTFNGRQGRFWGEYSYTSAHSKSVHWLHRAGVQVHYSGAGRVTNWRPSQTDNVGSCHTHTLSGTARGIGMSVGSQRCPSRHELEAFSSTTFRHSWYRLRGERRLTRSADGLNWMHLPTGEASGFTFTRHASWTYG